MCLKPDPIPPIPAETQRVAQAAFPHGSLPMKMRDVLGPLYTDDLFVDLYPPRGQPAAAPWRLALVTVWQFVEGLTDLQAAAAVRGRIDWKYGLSLELTDAGFDGSVLSEFRTRLVTTGAEQRLFTTLLDALRVQGYLAGHRQQRTDSTHILAAVRLVNRLELVGETLRAALNELARWDPQWLRAHITDDWFTRYSHRIEDYRLPQGQAERAQYAAVIGADGAALLVALAAEKTSEAVNVLPAVVRLHQVWEEQFITENEHLRWRTPAELAPSGERLASPYDPDARFGNKRSTTWTGYKVHLTETCAEDAPHLITQVTTTAAMIPDVVMTAPIHQTLMAHQVRPDDHIVDGGYIDADLLVRSQEGDHIRLIGPVRPNGSWQERQHTGYSLQDFTIDWEQHHAICPQGKRSSSWSPHQDAWQNTVIAVKFSRTDCRQCPMRSACTKAKEAPRHLTIRPQSDHEALTTLRIQQTTPAWKEVYDQRAGVEGLLSQGIRAFGLRRARFIGLPKVRLQHVLTACAINVVRLDAWVRGQPLATTRSSPFAALRMAG